MSRRGTYQPRQDAAAFLVRAALGEDAPVEEEEQGAHQHPAGSPEEEEHQGASPPDFEPQPLQARDAPHRGARPGFGRTLQPLRPRASGGGGRGRRVSPLAGLSRSPPEPIAQFPPPRCCRPVVSPPAPLIPLPAAPGPGAWGLSPLRRAPPAPPRAGSALTEPGAPLFEFKPRSSAGFCLLSPVPSGSCPRPPPAPAASFPL